MVSHVGAFVGLVNAVIQFFFKFNYFPVVYFVLDG